MQVKDGGREEELKRIANEAKIKVSVVLQVFQFVVLN